MLYVILIPSAEEAEAVASSLTEVSDTPSCATLL